MKKTIIAITIAAAFSSSAFAKLVDIPADGGPVTIVTDPARIAIQVDKNEQDIIKAESNAKAYTDQRVEVSNKYTDKRVSEESSATLAAANKYTDSRVEVSNKYTDKRATEEGKAAEANANAYTDQRVEVSNKYTDKRVGEAEVKIAGNSDSIKDLQSDRDLHEIAINANSGQIGQNQEDIYANKQSIDANKTAIVKTQKDAKDYTDKKSGETLVASKNYTNTQVGAERDARIEGDRQTLQSANTYTNQKFSELGKRVDKVRKEASAGTASALAASQIPQVETNGRFSLGAGVGGYNSQTAVAVGFSARINDRTVTKFAVTTDTQHNVGFGAGVAVSW